MHKPLTDQEWIEWLSDLEPYYGQDRPLAEAFLRLSVRCADAEAKLTRAEAVHVGWQREVLSEVSR